MRISDGDWLFWSISLTSLGTDGPIGSLFGREDLRLDCNFIDNMIFADVDGVAEILYRMN